MHQGACAVREVDLKTSLLALRDLPVGVAILQLPNPKDLRSLRLIGANQAVERELRAPIRCAIGKPIAETFPKFLDTSVAERYRQVALSGKPDTLGEFTYQDPRIPEGVFWMDCFPLPDRSVGVAVENITDRKRETRGQKTALQLLHRITLFLNDAPSVLDAAQFCIDEICTQIDWPVGRFFLADEMHPSHFLPNPVWHLSDPYRFKAFKRATELYESDFTNQFALKHRTLQGQKAGLARSVGFSVLENDSLRGVLEFSSEDSTPLDEHVFRAISNVGFQLGQAFARERLAREYTRVQELMLSQEVHHREVCKILFAGPGSIAATVGYLESKKRAHRAIERSSKDVLESVREIRQHLDDLKRIISRPIEFRPNPGSKAI